MKYRTGIGYDVHQLRDGLPFYLGGVKVEHTKGAVGHSDADVLIHAVCDALLGAANLGDIGKHFPDTDAAYKNADSLVLLARVNEIIKSAGYRVSNVDATVIAQAPKLAPHIEQMRTNIASALESELDDISVKATTEERLGFTGNGEGISAHAVCIIEKI